MMDRIELNGAPVGVDDLHILGRVAYGHFTMMQLRNGGVRGFDLHLERLRKSTRELFGTDIEPDLVRGYIRHALRGATSATIRVQVFPRTMDWLARSGEPIQPDFLVTIGAPRGRPTTAPRVKSVRYERMLPHIKHIGIALGLMKHGRPAIANGWDDVLFLDEEGRVEEGSVWNIGFFDGTRIVWPSAPALPGITLQLIQKGLAKDGIPTETREMRVEELSSFRAAFLTSTVSIAQAVACIDDTIFSPDTDLLAKLTECYESNPEEPV